MIYMPEPCHSPFYTVTESCNINKKLEYVNLHKDCELKQKQREVSQLLQQVMEANIKVNSQPGQTDDELHKVKVQLITIKQENEAVCECN